MSSEVTPRTRHLYRRATDRSIFGVCGGLADYFGIDPILVRLAFVLVTLAGGAGILVYLILTLVTPVEPDGMVGRPDPVHARGQAAGLVLMLVGAALLIGNLGLVPWFDWGTFWPVILVLLGTALLVAGTRSLPGPSGDRPDA